MSTNMLQLIEQEERTLQGDPPTLQFNSKPDMGPDIQVDWAKRILLDYETNVGNVNSKKWWKAAVTATGTALITWRSQPGNIGWISAFSPSPDESTKLWNGLTPLLQAKLPAGHTAWFLAPVLNGGGPDMVPSVGFDFTELYIFAVQPSGRKWGLWSGDIAPGQNSNAAAWLATSGNRGLNGATLPTINGGTSQAGID